MKRDLKEDLRTIRSLLFDMVIAILFGLLLSWIVGLIFRSYEPIPYQVHKVVGFFTGTVFFLYSVFHEDDFEHEYIKYHMKEEYRHLAKSPINEEGSTLENLPKCPTCNHDLLNHGQNYCDECGQLLGWKGLTHE